jgi:hypothetical protein
MNKRARKSDIRTAALAEAAALRDQVAARAAFLQPKPRSWHDVFLAALQEGARVSVATRAAGLSKSGVFKARSVDLVFRAAWEAAQDEAWARRRQKFTLERSNSFRRRIATIHRNNQPPKTV